MATVWTQHGGMTVGTLAQRTGGGRSVSRGGTASQYLQTTKSGIKDTRTGKIIAPPGTSVTEANRLAVQKYAAYKSTQAAQAERQLKLEQARIKKQQEASAKERQQQEQLTQEQIQSRTIGGQTESVVSLPGKKPSPIKYAWGTITSGLPAKEKLQRLKYTFQGETSQERKQREKQEAQAEADVLRFGKPEYFGGKSLSTLLPYQTRGTAEITEVVPYTEEELAGSIRHKGAGVVLGERQEKEAKIISFEAEQEAKGVVGEYQKKIDVLGTGIQEQVSKGIIPYELGVSEYEKQTKKLQEEAQKEYEKKYYEVAEPRVAELETKYEGLFKKQRRTAIITEVTKKSPLIIGTIGASALLPAGSVSTAATIGGVVGLAQLGKGKEYYQTTIDLKKTPEGKVLGYTLDEKLTSAGKMKLVSSGLLLAGGAYGLYRTNLKALDKGTLEDLQKKQSLLLEKEAYKTEKGLGVDAIIGKGFKYTKTGEVIPVGEAQQITKVRFGITRTGDKTFSIPVAKGESITKYYSYAKNKLIISKTPITATARGQIGGDVFKVSKQGDLLVRTQLKGWQSAYGKGVLVKGEKLQPFRFSGISKKAGGYSQIKTFEPTGLKISIRPESERYGEVTTLISKKQTGFGLIKRYKTPKPTYEIIKIPKKTTLLGKDGQIAPIEFKPYDTGLPPPTITKGAKTILQPQITKQVQDPISAGVVSASEQLSALTLPKIIQPTGFAIVTPVVKTKEKAKQIIIQQPKVKELEKTGLIPRTATTTQTMEATGGALLQPSMYQTMQSQAVVPALAQPQRLAQKQLLQEQLTPISMFAPSVQPVTPTSWGKGFFLPLPPQFSFGGRGKKKKAQRKKQETAYQASFTGIFTGAQVTQKEIKDYEKKGFGWARVRGVVSKAKARKEILGI